jgi:outer membrane receptor protein involved in Fe transport
VVNILRCLSLFLLLAGLVSPRARAQELAGSLRGSVYDKETGAPLARARVTVVEATLSGFTDGEGQFVLPLVPAGQYTVVISKEGFERQVRPGVIVVAGQVAELRAELAWEVVEMEPFLVRGLNLGEGTEMQLLSLRQESLDVRDAISSEMIKQAGASTAAAALRLVVGTSVVDGKYAVIRGLSDRYTVSELNKVRIPTADAEKRAVQLDQFPAGVIESIVVTKTFSADQQGDSTGGTVDIRLKSLPTERIFNVAFGLGANSQTTGEKYLTYKGGGVEAFGFGGESRERPVRYNQVPDYLGATTNPALGEERLPNAQKIDRITRSFEPVIGTKRETAPPDIGASATYGDRKDLAQDVAIGWLGSFTYSHKVRSRTGIRNSGAMITNAGEEIVIPPLTAFEEEVGQEEVLWGGVGMFGFEFTADHMLKLSLAYNQTATDEARLLVSEIPDTLVAVTESLRYQERSLGSLQLSGDHVFQPLLGMKLDWTGSLNWTKQDEPDFRTMRTIIRPDGLQEFIGQEFDLPRRVFRYIDETDEQLSVNAKWPVPFFFGKTGEVSGGGFYDEIERNFEQDVFLYSFTRQVGTGQAVTDNRALQNYRGDKLWSDVYLNPNRIGLAQNDPPAINQLLWYITAPNGISLDYRGEQKVEAFYGRLDLPVLPWVTLSGGARVEKTDLAIIITSDEPITIVQRTEAGDAYFVDIAPEDAGADINQQDVLPALGATVEIITNLNLRLNYAETIARPTFRELAPARSTDFIGGESFIGNPDLVISQIENYDVRVEWFRRPGDVLAASYFYKDFTDPIEQIQFDVTGGDRYVQRVNYPEGTLWGIEFEARQKLDIFEQWLDFAKYFSLGFNAAYIKSEVRIPRADFERIKQFGITDDTRPMFNQPEYVGNINCVFQQPNWGTTVSVFYSLIGETLITGLAYAGTLVPNVIEEETESLDMSVEQKIGKNWKVTFRAKNLTDPLVKRSYEVPGSERVTQSAYRRGVEYSLGASYAW